MEPEHQQPLKASAATTQQKHNPMEFLVLIAFIGTWVYTKDAIMATIVLTLGSALQLLIMLATKSIITKMQKAMFAAIFIGGGLTIMFQNPAFLMWKLSVVNGIFVLVLLAFHFMGKSPIKALMETALHGQDIELDIPTQSWDKLTFIFALFFASVALSNVYVVIYMDFNAWVWFRTGVTITSLIFFPLVLTIFLVKHNAFQQDSSKDQSESKIEDKND